MKKILALSILTSTFLLANGYKIPEQSTDAIALSTANIANVDSADAAYYNPANMAFMKNENFLEFHLTYIYLPPVKFNDYTHNTSYYSESQQFLVPQLHFVSKDYNGYRFGFSIIEPAGLSKKWDDTLPAEQAKEFTLKTYEFNPSIAKLINNNFAIAFGVRMVRSIAEAKGLYYPAYSYDLTGTSTDYGWNGAISYQDDEKVNKFAITYRSKVDLTLKGSASGYFLIPNTLNKYKYDTGAKTTVPIPATLDIAYSRKFNKTTVELVFERTFWGRYKDLDFNFDDPNVEAVFGQPQKKDWKNVNTYRIGITHQCTNKLTAMLGFAYDNTPVPNSTLDFALPDSDKYIYSAGFKYKINKKLTLGLAGLYAYQRHRNGRVYDIVTKKYTYGEFRQGGALLISTGINYSF